MYHTFALFVIKIKTETAARCGLSHFTASRPPFSLTQLCCDLFFLPGLAPRWYFSGLHQNEVSKKKPFVRAIRHSHFSS